MLDRASITCASELKRELIEYGLVILVNRSVILYFVSFFLWTQQAERSNRLVERLVKLAI